MVKLNYFIFLVSLKLFLALPLSETPPSLDGRIIGGESVSILQFPYQISLRYHGYHICGGTIYKSNIIITAAHCVLDDEPEDLTVLAGTSLRKEGGVELKVKNITYHPAFTFDTYDYDVAILLLDGYYDFSDTIQPIDLPQRGSFVRVGTSARVSGWGYLKEYGSLSDDLQSVILNIISKVECIQAFPTFLTERMICAKALKKDACDGDSGGPMVVAGTLVGIVSWGTGCARPDYPGVYSDVAVLRDWIEDNIVFLLSQ